MVEWQCVCGCVCMCVCVCVCVWMYVCVCMCVCVCLSVHTYVFYARLSVFRLSFISKFPLVEHTHSLHQSIVALYPDPQV